MVAPGARTLLVGFDGATWDLLQPAMRAGVLPHFTRFVEGGFRARLRSVEPSVTIPAWYCATTGRTPATLDRWGFTEPTGEPGRFRLITTYRPYEALWDLLGRRGWRVGVVNFPALPAPSVHGYFLSGMLVPHGEATTYPTSLAARLARELGGWDLDLPEFGPGRRNEALARAATSMDRKALAVEMLQGEYHPDLLFVLFSETDRLQHNYWESLAAFPEVDDPAVRSYWNALDEAFHRVVVAFHGEGTGRTWVLSDHGFGASEGYFFTNRFLMRAGYLRSRPGLPLSARMRPWLTDVLANADRAFPLRRPLRWVDHLRHRISPRAEGRDGDALDQTFGWFSQFVDWERSRAYSQPVPEAIYANTLKGPLSPEERQKLKQELTRDLLAYAPAEIRVVDPEELYGRPCSPSAPLLLITSRGGSWETRGDVNHRVEHLSHRPSYFQREGTHRPEGIFVLAGPGVLPGVAEESVPLMAIAPSVLASLGVATGEMEATPDAALLRALGPARAVPSGAVHLETSG